MDGAEGFEPPNTSTKNWCLTAWPRPIRHFKLIAYVDGIIAQKNYIVKGYWKIIENLSKERDKIDLFQEKNDVITPAFAKYS